MSYQALARKWRPRSFAEVTGQDHVVRALTNALASDRVHHAFLFAGTRGVGKTTLARLLAKALNCVEGVSAEPCGRCPACVGVDENRFVDLIEVDAASRTRVDDTRELLDNVQYAPTLGRYKIYLIDEVHMLSGHSFNALLKTLEEPPPHVKFLLATTDPQKLPPTILSRCLQFNLRALDPEQIVARFRTILDAEGIEADDMAVHLLARAARGSMRDGLSLLDQAIAFGASHLAADEVRDMLGMIDDRHALALLEALAAGEPRLVVAAVQAMTGRSIDFVAALDELLLALYGIALHQVSPETARERDGDRPELSALATRLAPELIQVWYQIALAGKRDLALAPDPGTGFEMTALRMLAFRPTGPAATPSADGDGGLQRPASAPRGSRAPAAVAGPAGKSAPTAPAAAPSPPARTSSEPKPSEPAPVSTEPAELLRPDVWSAILGRCRLNGLVGELAANLAPIRWRDDVLHVALAPALGHLNKPERLSAIAEALAGAIGRSLRIEVELDAGNGHETAVETRGRLDREARERAQRELLDDPAVRDLIDRFDAELDPRSVVPGGRSPTTGGDSVQ